MSRWQRAQWRMWTMGRVLMIKLVKYKWMG